MIDVHSIDDPVGFDRGKMMYKSFEPLKKSESCDACLKLAHIDVYGPLPVKSIEQKRYFLKLVDDYTQMSICNFLQRKFKVNRIKLTFEEFFEGQTEEKVKRLHFDSGSEYDSQILIDYLEQRAILSE